MTSGRFVTMRESRDLAEAEAETEGERFAPLPCPSFVSLPLAVLATRQTSSSLFFAIVQFRL